MSLVKNKVFQEICDLPVGFKALDTKIVLKIKKVESNDIYAFDFQARLCGIGSLQTQGIDFNETYAPVAAYNSIRVFLSIIASIDYKLTVLM